VVLSTVVVVALVGFALAAVGAAFQDVLVPPGQLSKQHIKAMLKDPVLKRGVLYKPLSWLASNAHFFPFASPTSYGGGGVGRLLGGWTVPATGVPVVLQAMAVNEKGTESPVVFSTGFAEVFVKYADLIRSLVKDGHPVYTFDLRGQGFSSTLVDVGDGSGPEGRVVDLGSIEDYTRDLHSFVEDHYHWHYCCAGAVGSGTRQDIRRRAGPHTSALRGVFHRRADRLVAAGGGRYLRAHRCILAMCAAQRREPADATGRGAHDAARQGRRPCGAVPQLTQGRCGCRAGEGNQWRRRWW